MIALQIMQTLGNRGKFGAKESFMTVMISHLESLECSSRLDTFFNDILTVSLDDNALEAAPSAALDMSFSDDSLSTIRSFFCRQVSCCVLPRSPANRLHACIPLTCLSPRHSSAILTRLQRESISRACSINEIVSRDRVFVATITDLQPNGIRLSPQTIQGMLRIIICMIIITIAVCTLHQIHLFPTPSSPPSRNQATALHYVPDLRLLLSDRLYARARVLQPRKRMLLWS